MPHEDPETISAARRRSDSQGNVMASTDLSTISGLGFPEGWMERLGTPEFPDSTTLPPEATSGGAVAMPLPAPSGGGMPLNAAGSGLPLGQGTAPAPAADDEMRQVIAELIGRPLPAEPTESPGYKNRLLAARIADALSGFGKNIRRTNYAGMIQEGERLRIAQSAEARKNEIEWRKLALSGIQEIRELKGAEWTRFDQAVDSGLRNIVLAPTGADRRKIADAYGQASGSALVTDTLLRLAGSSPDLQRLAGRVYPFLETQDEKATALATVNGLLRPGKGGQRATDQEIIAKIEAAGAMPVVNTLMAHLPGVIAGVAGLPEEQQFDAAAKIIRSVPGKGPAMADAMNGDAFVKEQYPRLLEVFSRMGLPLPGKQKEAAEKFMSAKETRAGTLAAEQTPQAIAGAGEVAEAVKAGQVRAETAPDAVKGQAALAEAKAEATETGQLRAKTTPVGIAREALVTGTRREAERLAEEPFKVAAERRADFRLREKEERDEDRAERKTRFDQNLKATGPALPEEVDRLRDDFRKDSQKFVKLRDGFSAVQASFANQTGVRRTIADQGLVYALAKVFDPEGVVREADYAAIAKSGTWGDTFTRAWNKVAEGGMLSQDLRNEIMVEAKKRYDDQLTLQMDLESQYEKLAAHRKIDRGRIIVDYGLPAAHGANVLRFDAKGRRVK